MQIKIVSLLVINNSCNQIKIVSHPRGLVDEQAVKSQDALPGRL